MSSVTGNKYEGFALRVRTSRKAAGYSGRKALAEACGLSEYMLANYENGKSYPTAEGLIALSNALRVDPTYLLTGKLPVFELWKKPVESIAAPPDAVQVADVHHELSTLASCINMDMSDIEQLHPYLDLVLDVNLLKKIKPTHDELAALLKLTRSREIKDVVHAIAILYQIRKNHLTAEDTLSDIHDSH